MLKTIVSLTLCLAMMSTCGFGQTIHDDASPPENQSTQLGESIDRLIAQLGDLSYAKRVRAREELARLGLIAFDSLKEATSNDDSEIAMSARFLLESLHVAWSTDQDAKDVRDALHGYGGLPEVERMSRIDQLAKMPDRMALAALCRLVRFETAERLSRAAALLILEQPELPDPKLRRRSSLVIHETLGTNKRQGSAWLLTYADDLIDNSFNAPQWQAYIDEERERVASLTTRSTDDMVVLQLYRICSVHAAEHGMDDVSHRLAIESLDMVDGRKQSLREAAQWAIDHQMWDIVLALQKREPRDFKNDPYLAYAVADALTETGDEEGGKTWVSAALALAPLEALKDDGTSPMPADQLETTASKHLVLAISLRDRGRFNWAQLEFEYLIEHCPVDTTQSALARNELASMLADQERYGEAAKLLAPMVERMKMDSNFSEKMRRELRYAAGAIECNALYCQGMQQVADNEPELARKTFRSAYGCNKVNSDLLIAMYRIKTDEQWNNFVTQAIAAALRKFESNMSTSKENTARNRNQYAWLVANTQGDFKRALAFSRLAVEQYPKEGIYIDTLSHCYYALGDLEAAVQTQRKAAAFRPHSPPILRQLKFFEQQLKAAQAADAKSSAQ